MVFLEGACNGNADGQVGKQAEPAVELRVGVAKGLAVADLVLGKHERVVESAAERICKHQHRSKRQVLEQIDACELEEHNGQHLPLEEGIDNKELLDLGMLLCTGVEKVKSCACHTPVTRAVAQTHTRTGASKQAQAGTSRQNSLRI